VAAAGLVDALHQSQLYQAFNGAVDGYQTKLGICLATQVKQFEGAEGARAV